MTTTRPGRDLFRHVARAVPWEPVLVTGVLAVALTRAAPSVPVALPATLVAAGACFAFDDRAADLLAASPTSLWRRRVLAMALVVPLAAGAWWAVVLADALGPDGGFPPLAEYLLPVTLVAVALAVAAAAARRSPDGMGSAVAGPALVAFVFATAVPREAWALHPVPAHAGRWAAILAIASIAVPAASRDLARASIRRRSGRANRAGRGPGRPSVEGVDPELAVLLHDEHARTLGQGVDRLARQAPHRRFVGGAVAGDEGPPTL